MTLGFKQLLTTNAKLDLYSGGYKIFGAQLKPDKILCPASTAECRENCLDKAGNGRFPIVQNARKNRSKLYHTDKKLFFKLMDSEIEVLKLKYKKLAIRANTFSDYPLPRTLTNKHKDVIFYDYTKNISFIKSQLRKPRSNYDLTFSYSGKNMKDCLYALENGFRVSVVARTLKTVESLFPGRKVINGDDSDARFLDEKGVIVWLSPKGVKNTVFNSFINN